MCNKKGFTLMELIIVMVIIGILAAIAVPSYFTSMQQGAAKAAQNNLIAIYNAQQNYYINPVTGGKYYISLSYPNADLTLNTNLSLNITDNNFSYSCTATAPPAPTFSCTATNNTDNTFTLTVTNNSIVLPGGTNCTTSPWGPPCNPACANAANPSYCPS